jgi:hypothetical protein
VPARVCTNVSALNELEGGNGISLSVPAMQSCAPRCMESHDVPVSCVMRLVVEQETIPAHVEFPSDPWAKKPPSAAWTEGATTDARGGGVVPDRLGTQGVLVALPKPHGEGPYGRHTTRARAPGKNVCPRDAVLLRVSGRTFLRFILHAWSVSRILDGSLLKLFLTTAYSCNHALEQARSGSALILDC